MSWGNKLVIVFIAFAALMATLVYRAVTTKFELVTKDYYKDELRYQDKLDGATNAVAAGNIKLLQDASTIGLTLPISLQRTALEGEAWFYCKTDATKDKRIQLKIQDGRYVFDKSAFQPGSYELKLQLSAGTTLYYYNEFITLQ